MGRFIQPDSIVPGAGNPQAWNRYSYTLNNSLSYTDPDGHVSIPIILLAAVKVIFTVVDWGWTGYDTITYMQTAVDPNNSPEVQKEAWGNAAITVGMELIEPDESLSPIPLPVDDVIRHGDEIGEFIYKKGSDTFDNVTPRPGIDDTSLEKGGLSFWDSVESLKQNMGLEPKDKIITVDPKQIDELNITLDNNPPGHVSVKPNTLDELQEWASTRGTGVVHKYTQTIWDAIVKVTKWKDWK